MRRKQQNKTGNTWTETPKWAFQTHHQCTSIKAVPLKLSVQNNSKYRPHSNYEWKPPFFTKLGEWTIYSTPHFFTKVQNVFDERQGETGDTHFNKIRCVTNGHKCHKVGLRAGGWTPNNAVIAVGSDWVPSVIPKSPLLTNEYFNVLSWLKRNSHRYIDRWPSSPARTTLHYNIIRYTWKYQKQTNHLFIYSFLTCLLSLIHLFGIFCYLYIILS